MAHKEFDTKEQAEKDLAKRLKKCYKDIEARCDTILGENNFVCHPCPLLGDSTKWIAWVGIVTQQMKDDILAFEFFNPDAELKELDKIKVNKLAKKY